MTSIGRSDPLSADELAEIQSAEVRTEQDRAAEREALVAECGGCWVDPKHVDYEALRRCAPLPLVVVRILRGLVNLSRGPSRRVLNQLGGQW